MKIHKTFVGHTEGLPAEICVPVSPVGALVAGSNDPLSSGWGRIVYWLLLFYLAPYLSMYDIFGYNAILVHRLCDASSSWKL